MGEGTKVELGTPLSFTESQILPYVNDEGAARSAEIEWQRKTLENIIQECRDKSTDDSATGEED